MDNKELYLNFDEYIRQGEPGKRERADAWRVAIGLQAVDGLKTSEYLQETARRNIEGEITIDEARELVKQYYIKKTAHDKDDEDREEDWKMPESEQEENKHRTSTVQVTEQVRALVLSIGKDQLTLKQMMEKMNLKHRPNFIDNYLNPAIVDGYIRLLYPQSPRHPRQKYLLTVKGLALYNDLNM